ncbi:galactosylceramide sulfotransferase-like [Oratosquilla oratoria]|uniref:galactosylceramide sulfotransferase-like n=1 Tax=Oratosquilla oratoria TaxID=337810 RepID=UPI003F761B21
MKLYAVSFPFLNRFRRLTILFPALILVLFLSLQSPNLRWIRMGAATPAWMYSEKECIPVTNVAFLKTHKCASSAIQNILFRYAFHQNLRLPLPSRSNYFGGPVAFHASMVKDTQWDGFGYNIFATHTKWNHEQVAAIMPKDTIYISIVRDPVELFESLFNYAKLSKVTRLSLEQYMVRVNKRFPRQSGFLGINQMAWDFGLPKSMMENVTAARELVADVDTMFDLVMVAERMDESLVLLKNLLCWTWEDVVVLKVNARKKDFKTEINPKLRKLMKSKLEIDYLLYDHFYAKFDDLVDQFGRDRMARELEELNTATMEVLVKCDFQKKDAGTMHGPNKPWSRLVQGYETHGSDETCGDFIRTELAFIDVLRKRQLGEAMQRRGVDMAIPYGAKPLEGDDLEETVRRLKGQLQHKHKDPPS